MICRNCGKMVLPDDGHIIDSAFYCEECSVECIECGEYILKEAATETYDGNFICEDCYYDNYFTCEDCGKVYPSEDCHWIADEGKDVCITN